MINCIVKCGDLATIKLIKLLSVLVMIPVLKAYICNCY